MKSRKIVVYHSLYGCDTGCCGHTIEIDGKQHGFYFTHPYWEATEEELKAWAQKLVKDQLGEDHVADLDWENCLIVDT